MKKKRMKLWKKITLVFVLFFTFCILLPLSYIIYHGYREYDAAIRQQPLSDYVSSLRAQDDYVTIEHIDNDLLNATIAIEDRRFYYHNGIDLIGIARAITDSILAKNIVGGGSTITQQLAKNLYFPFDYSLERKVAEALTARQLEKNYTKDEILELYVNVINYGDNHIGIKQAANGYFQKSPDDLTLYEASLLAGLPQSPANFQLSNHFDAALVRQQQVLNAMSKEEMITPEQRNAVLNP